MRQHFLLGFVALVTACSSQPTAPLVEVVAAPAPGIYQLVAINGVPIPQPIPYLPACPSIATYGDLDFRAGGTAFIWIAGTHHPGICQPETDVADSVRGSWVAEYEFYKDSIRFHRANVSLLGVPLPDVNFRGSFDAEVIRVMVPPSPLYFSKSLILFTPDSFVATFKRH